MLRMEKGGCTVLSVVCTVRTECWLDIIRIFLDSCGCCSFFLFSSQRRVLTRTAKKKKVIRNMYAV